MNWERCTRQRGDSAVRQLFLSNQTIHWNAALPFEEKKEEGKFAAAGCLFASLFALLFRITGSARAWLRSPRLSSSIPASAMSSVPSAKAPTTSGRYSWGLPSNVYPMAKGASFGVGRRSRGRERRTNVATGVAGEPSD